LRFPPGGSEKPEYAFFIKRPPLTRQQTEESAGRLKAARRRKTESENSAVPLPNTNNQFSERTLNRLPKKKTPGVSSFNSKFLPHRRAKAERSVVSRRIFLSSGFGGQGEKAEKFL
jgi:hypothetical protein